MSGINEFIDSEVKSQDVVLFMKGTPGFPQCGFSGLVVQILDYLGVDYKGVNVLTSDELRQDIKEDSNWPTIPQLYVKGEFVGGCDIIREMFQAGELQQFLGEKGVSAGGIAAEFGMSASRLSFHLSTLEQAGLIRARRESRHIFYSVDPRAMGALIAYLLNDCCMADPKVSACCTAPVMARER